MSTHTRPCANPECGRPTQRARAKYCCDQCRRRHWYARHRERIKAQTAAWKTGHPDLTQEYRVRWRQRNRKKERDRQRRRRSQPHERARENARARARYRQRKGGQVRP